jgi:hypothetical protein
MPKCVSIIGLVAAGAVGSAHAHWLNYRDPKIPRTAAGQPNLSAPAPRLSGKPDLTGVWRAESTSVDEFRRVLGEEIAHVQVDLSDVTKYMVNVFWDIKPGEEPVRPETAALVEQRLKASADFQTAQCLPSSIPAAMLVLVFKMIQTPGEIVVLFDNGDPPRQIYTDGRRLPKDPEPSWMGSSVGKWEGDTLVVETTGFNTRAWLDGMGHPRSESMRITERYRRRDFGHMDVEMSFDDPRYYTRPFSFKTALTLVPDSDVLEYICTENEKDLRHVGQ